VVYAPTAKVVQGNQPLSESYTLTITSPSNLPANTPVTISLVPTVLSKPTTVDDATALGFISFTPASLTFSGPNQSLTTTVAVNVPAGDFAGNYAYKIKPSGWPASLAISDTGATVNALVSPAKATDNTPPAVVLQTPADGNIYTYFVSPGVPVSVPLTFEGTVGTGGNPITGLQAFLNGSPVIISTSGIGTLDATGSATLSLTLPGLYHIRVAATNQDGTSEDSADITVVISAPPPVITVASPTANSSFTFPTGGSGVTLPVSYTATSIFGNIISTGTTLNGSPIVLSLSGVGTSLVATGSASLSITSPGNYYLNFTAANDYGNATPVTVPFTVATVTPVPTVKVLTPVAGTVFTRTVGDPATTVNYTFNGGTNFGTVTSVTVTVDGTPVTATVNGLNTAAITGSGALSYSAGGTHVLSVTLSNGTSSATDSTTFTVSEQAAPPPVQVCEKLTWLPPICFNKTIKGGCTMPIYFRLDNGSCNFVRDESVLISIYEINADGSMTNPVIYPYGGANPNAASFAINRNSYQLNFPTAAGVHHYRIEVYHPLTADGSSLQLLGTKDLLTSQASSGDCHNGNNHGDNGDHHGDCNNDRDHGDWHGNNHGDNGDHHGDCNNDRDDRDDHDHGDWHDNDHGGSRGDNDCRYGDRGNSDRDDDNHGNRGKDCDDDRYSKGSSRGHYGDNDQGDNRRGGDNSKCDTSRKDDDRKDSRSSSKNDDKGGSDRGKDNDKNCDTGRSGTSSWSNSSYRPRG
jgi:hypothetical protein